MQGQAESGEGIEIFGGLTSANWKTSTIDETSFVFSSLTKKKH